MTLCHYCTFGILFSTKYNFPINNIQWNKQGMLGQRFVNFLYCRPCCGGGGQSLNLIILFNAKLTSKNGSIGNAPACGPRDLSLNPAWGKLEWTNFFKDHTMLNAPVLVRSLKLTTLGQDSTWMGDHLGTLGAVGFF